MLKQHELLWLSETSDERCAELLQEHILQDFIYLSGRALHRLSILILLHAGLSLALSTSNQY